jgi:hypothetical protein
MTRRTRALRWLFTRLSRATVAAIYHQGYRDGVNEVRDGMAAHQQAQATYAEKREAEHFSRGFAAGLRAATPATPEARPRFTTIAWQVPPARRPA